MKIDKNSVVSLSYELKNIDGQVLDSSAEPVNYLLGGYDNIFPKVEQALMGKNKGDLVSVDLQPEDAFGDYDEALLQIEPASVFPADALKVGVQFEGEDPTGDIILYTVTDIADGKVVLDGNHPAAGERLIYSGKIMGVRVASKEELTIEHALRYRH
ncbi:MAG: peptidylprolyl isomerase [Pseudomonadota bacterium]|nr:peptidylprolyl isomerase [Pseudomonadota bacterium]MDO7710924.1 peptidylprolyl isomerase [Pseudomonadota bacterium]